MPQPDRRNRWANPCILPPLSQLLAPTRALATVVSKRFEKEADREERWYKTKYKVRCVCPRHGLQQVCVPCRVAYVRSGMLTTDDPACLSCDPP